MLKSFLTEAEPQPKYSVLEEYEKKNQKFNEVREQLKNKERDDSLRIQIRKLESKVKNLERAHAIELRYAKETAKERAHKLITTKLQSAKKTFDEEFKFLADQYQ